MTCATPRVARVFPRRTAATPDDGLCFTDPPGLFPPIVDEVHVSVAFTWDIPHAQWLAKQWDRVAPVRIGGPAIGTRGGDFEPGRYVRDGYTITSRGCPNRCWFCDVWKRDGDVRELPIRDGCNVLDDNLLACGDRHVRDVFAMLARQSGDIQFTGGLEAARLQNWHAGALRALRPRQVFFAYDNPRRLEALQRAGAMMLDAGFTKASHRLRCYVLIGHPRDSHDAAEDRLLSACDAGFMPMAMLWRNKDGAKPPGWQQLQRRWARPAIIASAAKGLAP